MYVRSLKSIAGLKQFLRKFIRRRCEWSIGIYLGKSHVDLDSPETISNPVLTAKDITDVPADFVADPFMLHENGSWYMFFEVMNARDRKGDIGLATSVDGLKWTYQKIVLSEPFHLSYPYVFKWNHDYYMIPESYKSNSIRLYKAVDFPTKWTWVTTLLDGGDYVDSSIFQVNDRWWLFTSSPKGNILRLYYANELMGDWVEHPKSPIIQDNENIARPGGRVVIVDGKIYRYTQDVECFYGNQVRAFEITKLTPTNYEEKQVKQNPILKASGEGWNKIGMHTIDPHKIEENKWIACVDGYSIKVVILGSQFDSDLANWTIGTLSERIEQFSQIMRLNY